MCLSVLSHCHHSQFQNTNTKYHNDPAGKEGEPSVYNPLENRGSAGFCYLLLGPGKRREFRLSTPIPEQWRACDPIRGT